MGKAYQALYWIIPIATLAAIPHFAPKFYVFLMGSVLIYGLFALSFNLLFGYTGLLSFGQAGFFALGAYTMALVLKEMTHTGYIMYFAIFCTLSLSFVGALIVGIICVRLTGWVFAMVTLAFGQVIFAIVYKWREVTGGDDGLYGIPIPSINVLVSNIDLKSLNNHYYYILVIVMISIIILRVIVNSPFGYALRSIRDNPIRAQFIGLNVWNYRLASFVIAGTFSGLAGGLFSPFKGIANPELASWSFSAHSVIMSLIGGTGVFIGPVIGAVFYRFAEYFITTYTGHWMLFFGTVLLVCVISFPGGITPHLIKVGRGLYELLNKSMRYFSFRK